MLGRVGGVRGVAGIVESGVMAQETTHLSRKRHVATGCWSQVATGGQRWGLVSTGPACSATGSLHQGPPTQLRGIRKIT